MSITQAGGYSFFYNRWSHVDLDMLHVALLPEIKMGPSGNAVIRFGAMAGGIVGGREHGGLSQYDMFVRDTQEYDRPADEMYRADMRLLLGFGFRVPLGRHVVFSIDPYTSGSITTITRDQVVLYSRDHGLRFGLAAVLPGRTLTEGRLKGKAAQPISQ
jgi:hypothetical protein